MRTIATLLGCICIPAIHAQRIVGINGEGVQGLEVNKLLVHEGRLVIAGEFTSFNGHPCSNVVRWDGGNGIEDLPGAFGEGDKIFDMLEVDGGLIAAGRDNGAHVVKRWIDGQWAQLGGAFAGEIKTLAYYDGTLYAGGAFTEYDGDMGIAFIAAWNGTVWQRVGDGLNDVVHALAVFGSKLYAAGRFTQDAAGSAALMHMAAFDGSNWEDVDQGLNGKAVALLVHEGRLIVWGDFTSNIGGGPLNGLAAFDGATFEEIPQEHPVGIALGEGSLFDAGEYGFGMSSDRSVFMGPRQVGSTCRLRTSALFNGTLYVGGRSASSWFVPTNIRGGKIGKVVPGISLPIFNAHGMEAAIGPRGTILCDNDWLPGLRLPTSEGPRSLVLGHGYFLVGYADDTVRVSPLDPWDYTGQYGPGPTCSDATAAFHERYWRVRTVDRGMIWDHEANSSTPGYMPYEEIMTWPAHGNTDNGEPGYLAPFSDDDGNGSYAPGQGETPRLRGDRMAWTVINDAGADTGFPELGTDAFMTAYAYDEPPPALAQVLLLSYQFVNRSRYTYDPAYVGLWTDFDLGDPYDDAGGCAPDLDMYFAYNAEPEDPSSGSILGFGAHPPAVGVVSLNARMNSFLAIVPPGMDDIGPPATYGHLVHGLYPGGTPIIIPGTQTATPFQYHGLPNDPGGFVMSTDAGLPNDMRGVATYGPFHHIAPGDTICFDIAYIVARDMQMDNIGNAMLLRQRAEAVHDWYDMQGPGCGRYEVLGVSSVQGNDGPFTLFPNPAATNVFISGDITPSAEVTIWSVTGQQTRTALVNGRAIDLSGVDAGLYIVRIADQGRQMTQRLVKVDAP